MPGLYTTGFQEAGVDIGTKLLEKSYLLDVYPALIPTFAAPGLWLWGSNSYLAQLGDNTVVSKSSPVQTVAAGSNWKQVDCGYYHTGAIKTDGTLWMWGYNSNGRLGDNTAVSKSSPVQTVAGGTNWKQVACGAASTAAIKTDGTLWQWGLNSSGQLGDNTAVSKSSPVQTVTGGTNWKQVACGGNHAAATKFDGSLWLWGSNSQGQLGYGALIQYSSPVQTVAGGNNWKQVSCGSLYTAAIKTDGTLWMWGYNNSGQLGDGSSVLPKSSPVQTVAGGTNWKQVTCKFFQSAAAIKTDGTLWTWGRNIRGQLGDNTTTDRSSPVQTVAGGTNWKQVDSGLGGENVIALKIDGTVWAWGNNSYGQLGDNTTTAKSSPVQTVAGGTNWKQVAAGRYHSAAIKEFGDW